jgi:hypothetical protein
MSKKYPKVKFIEGYLKGQFGEIIGTHKGVLPSQPTIYQILLSNGNDITCTSDYFEIVE